jgi:hypothetical protein
MSTNFYRTLSGQISFWGMYNDAQTYLRGSATSDLADAAGSAMAQYEGMVTLPITGPTTEAIDFAGDNGTKGTMTVNPVGVTTAAATNILNDLAFKAAANGYKIVTDGNQIGIGHSDVPPALNPMAMIINSPAASNDLATLDNAEWEVTEILNMTVHDQGGTNFSTRTPREFLKNFVFNRKSTRLDGRALSVVTNGTTALLWHTYTNPNPVIQETYVGDGNVGQEHILAYTPAGITASEIRIVKNGTPLVITTDYTVVKATKTVSFTPAGDPASAENCQITYDIDETEWGVA